MEGSFSQTQSHMLQVWLLNSDIIYIYSHTSTAYTHNITTVTYIDHQLTMKLFTISNCHMMYGYCSKPSSYILLEFAPIMLYAFAFLLFKLFLAKSGHLYTYHLLGVGHRYCIPMVGQSVIHSVRLNVTSPVEDMLSTICR